MRGSVHYSGRFRCYVRRLSKRERKRGKERGVPGGRVFKRFRSHIIGFVPLRNVFFFSFREQTNITLLTLIATLL